MLYIINYLDVRCLIFDLITSHSIALSYIECVMCICNFLCITTFSLMQLSTLHWAVDNRAKSFGEMRVIRTIPSSCITTVGIKCLHGISRNYLPFIIMTESSDFNPDFKMRNLNLKFCRSRHAMLSMTKLPNYGMLRNFLRANIDFVEKFTVKIKAGILRTLRSRSYSSGLCWKKWDTPTSKSRRWRTGQKHSD